MKSEGNLIGDMLKEIPLEIRLKVAIQAYFIAEEGGSFFMPLDENGNDLPEVVEKNEECFNKAKPIIDLVLKELEEWKKDGCP